MPATAVPDGSDSSLDDLSSRLRRSALLGEIWTRFGSTLEWELLLPIIVEKTVETIDAEAGSLWLHEPARNTVACVKATGAFAERVQGQELPFGKGIVSSVIQSGEARFIPDVRREADFSDTLDRQSGFQTRSMIIAAVKGSGKVLGAMEVINKRGTEPGLFTQDDLDLLLVVAAAAGQALENARLHAELGRAYDKVAEANRRLLELDRAKSEFVSVASHELRTPISALLGYLHLICTSQLGVPEHLRESLEHLERASERLSAIVVRITDALKVETLGFSLQRAPCDPCRLAREVVEELSQASTGRRLALTLSPGVVPSAEMDADKIKVALSNLVRNAIRFTPDLGRIQVKVERTRDRRGRPAVAYEVSDSGIGIPAHERERIFDRFATGADPMTHHSGTFEFGSRGLGLGLYLARALARAHGGDITVETTLGKGSTFRMVVPAAAPVATP